jgi:hypothetical protein
MAHFVDKAHLPDRQTVARVNGAIVFGVIGTGLAVCALGAIVYDIGRLFFAW